MAPGSPGVLWENAILQAVEKLGKGWIVHSGTEVVIIPTSIGIGILQTTLHYTTYVKHLWYEQHGSKASA